MFQIHKKPQGDAAVKKSVQKILDHKKDVATRLKHLRLVLDLVTEQSEIQSIFEQYYSHIYHVFFENFLLAEANVRQKGAHRSQREELDSILQIFETVLIRLPDMLHERWQYNSIDHIIKKLIHPGNSLKIRRDGIRFFLLWFRALRENARETTILLYASLVPGFPPPATENEKYIGCTLESLLNPVPDNQSGMCPAEIACIVPPPTGEKNPPDLTKYFLDAMLEFMVVEARKLQWKEGHTVDTQCFSFLWDMFKKYYLPHIFQDFHFETSIYQPDLALPEPREPVNYILNVTETGTIDACIEVAAGCPMLPARVSTIKWVVAFTSNALHNENKSRPGSLPEKTSMSETDLKPSAAGNLLTAGGTAQETEASHSNASTLTEKAPSLSSLSSLDDKLRSSSGASEEEELVRDILYSTRENVNIVHEIFRQALMLPLTEATTMRRVIKVYQEWIQDGVVPVFMEDPDLNTTSDHFLTENKVGQEVKLAENGREKSSSSNLQNVSYMRGQLNSMLDQDSAQVRAGCQTTYQLFVTNSAHVFLVEPPTDAPKLVQAQVDVCKRVLNLYRHMVMHVSMDSTTWTQLLQVLLHITRIMLQDADIANLIRTATVASRLAGPVFQTLIVSWIKANLFVHVSRELWDELVDVLSSLRQWKDLIVEWARNMDTMTRVLARHVYGLELSDLPLDRLTEQKQKKNRKAALKGWSRESIQPHSAKSQIRARSRSAVGVVSTLRPGDSTVDNKHPSTVAVARDISPEAVQRSNSRGRSITVLGLESAPEIDPSLQDTSILGQLPEHTGHMPLKRGRSDNSSLSVSPKGLGLPDTYLEKPDNLQRSSSTSDITSEKDEENYSDVPKIIRGQSMRQRCNSGPGYRDGEDGHEGRVHGLRIPKEEDDGITSLSSVEDTFNDMFDELIQQRLNTVNPKQPVVEVWNKQSDVVSVKSQDSGSIDPNWNPWGETEAQQRESPEDEPGVLQESSNAQFFSEYGQKMTAELSDLKDDDVNDWGTCLEDASFGTLPPQLTEPQLTLNQEEPLANERVSMLSKDQNTSSETASPGLSSPPYQIYKHVARDRYDSTALLLPETRTDTVRSENNESILEEDEGDESPDAEAMHEKSSDDILGVHCSTPQTLAAHPGSSGFSDVTSGDEGSLEGSSTLQDKTDSILAPAEDCSILAGGRRTGWSPDVAVALWRRLLGILGDVNEVEDPVNHQLIFTYLLKFWDVLAKMRENLGITTDNASTPPPPELVPPLRIMAPWAFKAVMSLSDSHKGGRLHAYQLLCSTTLQRHDTRLEPEHLALFYLALHEGLHSDQDAVNEIVESSSPRFFSCCLPASTLLLLDFIYACHAVAASTDLSGPRVEAQTILGSVLCFPNLYYDLPVLNPDSEEPQALPCNNIKEYVADALLTSAKKEPSAPARCVALSSLGVWLYEELTSPEEEGGMTPSPSSGDGFVYSDTNLSPVKGRILARHGRVKEAINVLLVSLKFNNRVVASVACSQLHLLTHCTPQLLEYMPEMPARIIEVMSLTASALLQNSDAKSSEDGRQLLVALLLCICDWCMLVPLTMLIDTTAPGSDKRLIRTVFKALQTGALGKPGHSAKHSYSLSDLASKDFDPYLQIDKVQEGSDNGSSGVLGRNNKLTLPPMPSVVLGTDNVVSLTASTVLSHLTNLLGHFPLAKGPAVLDSLVTEQQDHSMDDSSSADLSHDLFNSPNVQFLIYNDTCLLSMVEIPAQNDVPGGGPTAGLSTAPTDVRVIVRDTSGKFCWDSSILYGAPDVQSQMKPVTYVPLSTMDREISKVISEHCRSYISYAEAELGRKQRVRSTAIPSHTVSLSPEHANDKLDQLLQYIGCSSPECQETPGRPLNIPATTPRALEDSRVQGKALEFILQQHKTQSVNYSANAHHTSCRSRPAHPLAYAEPHSPFHQSRLLISEAGFLSRENRRRVNLLKKNERLLRELKNLDSRHCRETHKVAVLYIAPGQEDKLSVLSNTSGSEDFENFVSALGWEIDLKSHCGFRGKLHSDGSTGATAPYYATSTLEVVFHVSTRFPSTNNDSRNVKLKHLGNDEVHIVWSEHNRDYRRGIIPTEFGDVLIIIYPMRHMLYRIQIKKKPEVPYFGPLFDGAIVNARVLPVLVRETAVNAGRAKRSQINLYQPFYEERAKYLRQIIDQFKDDTTFEDYAAQLFSPTHGRTPSPGSKAVKRPAPKPSPPFITELPSTQTAPGPSPSPVVGKVVAVISQQQALIANSNNNNNTAASSLKYDVTNGIDVPGQNSAGIIKEQHAEKYEGTRYTPGLQLQSSASKTGQLSQTPATHPTASKLLTVSNLISTPRPKPGNVQSNSLSSLNFTQHSPQQTNAYAAPVSSSSRIHIPTSKIQSFTPKTSGSSAPSTPIKKVHPGGVKMTSASSTGIILVPPPPGSRPIPSSPGNKTSSQFPYQDALR